VTLTATFEKNQLLYFDSNNRLQVGAWGVQVTAANIAYFKFGSVVGFTMVNGSDTWDMTDIKFEPSTAKATTYRYIPAWDDFPPGSKPSSYSTTTNAGFVSETVHTLANVKLGMGDPCQLVGYTGAEISAMSSLPASSFRLPTNTENSTFVGFSGTAAANTSIGTTYATFTTGSPGIGTFPNSSPTNQILPAVGGRNFTDGSDYNWGTNGYYWSSTPLDDSAAGYLLRFTSSDVRPSNYGTAERGYTVRCVPQ
jgi:hypothetical protein